MLTQIINGKILTPQGWLKDGSVIMRDNKILEVTNCDMAVVGANLIACRNQIKTFIFLKCHIFKNILSTFALRDVCPQNFNPQI